MLNFYKKLIIFFKRYGNQFLQKAFGFAGHLMLRGIHAVRYTCGVDINSCAFVEDASEGGTENLIRRPFR